MPDSTDVAAVVQRAARAADAFAETDRHQRAELLTSAATALETARAEIVELADSETHLGTVRLDGELTRTANQFRFLAHVVTEGGYLEATVDEADETVTPRRPDLRRMLLPLGPIAVFGASNFPLAFGVPGSDTASALAAGCPVVVKGHPGHPRTSRRLFAILTDVVASEGFQPGTVALIEGIEAGRELVAAPEIKAVGFTGSQAAGLQLAAVAAARKVPIPFFGELGSVNPVVITREAAATRGDEIAGQLVSAVALGAGQFCTKPGLVFVPSGPQGDRLQDAAVRVAAAVPAALMLTPGIRSAFESGVSRLRDDSRVRRLGPDPVASPAQTAVSPSLFSVAARDLTVELRSECFGPMTIFVRYDDDDDLSAAIGELEGQLTATIHAEPTEMPGLRPLVARLAGIAGRVVFGGAPTGVTVSWAMHHGGPFPASTSPAHTSVGAAAIRRWLRPVCFQDAPDDVLPRELRRAERVNAPRRVNGHVSPPRCAV